MVVPIEEHLFNNELENNVEKVDEGKDTLKDVQGESKEICRGIVSMQSEGVGDPNRRITAWNQISRSILKGKDTHSQKAAEQEPKLITRGTNPEQVETSTAGAVSIASNSEKRPGLN
jgi:hypothetical protein